MKGLESARHRQQVGGGVKLARGGWCGDGRAARGTGGRRRASGDIRVPGAVAIARSAPRASVRPSAGYVTLCTGATVERSCATVAVVVTTAAARFSRHRARLRRPTAL